MKKFKSIRLISVLMTALLIFGNISYGITAMAAASTESYASEDKGSAADDRSGDDKESTEDRGTAGEEKSGGEKDADVTDDPGEDKKSSEDKGSDDVESDAGESDADIESGNEKDSDEEVETGEDEGSGEDEEIGEDEGSDKDGESAEDEGSDKKEGSDEKSAGDKAGDDESYTVKDSSNSDGEDEKTSDEEEEEDWIDGPIDLEEASPSDAIQMLSSNTASIGLEMDEDGVYRLHKDTELDERWKISDEEVVLDLNGYTLSNSSGSKDDYRIVYEDGEHYVLISIVDGGSLEIMDSADGGKITSSLDHTIALYDGGEVSIYGVDIENSSDSSRAVWGHGATVDINDSTVEATGNNAYAVCLLAGSDVSITGSSLLAEKGADTEALRVGRSQVEISDSIITSSRIGIYAANGTVIEINDTDVYGEVYGIYINNGSTVTVNGGAVKAHEDKEGVVFAVFGDNDHDTTELIINDGEFSGCNVINSNSNQKNIRIDINGGHFSSSHTAIYLPSEGTMNFNDGIIEAEVNGITVRNGDLNISGGEIRAYGDNAGESGAENGYSGMAVLIGQHTGDREINVDISGGELFGKTYALYEEDYTNDHNYESDIHVSISGGIFSNANSGDVHPVDIKDEDDEWSGAEYMISITGGFFSDHVEESDYIDEGYMCIDGISVTGESGNSYSDYHTVIPDTFTDADLSFSYSSKTFTYNGTAQVPAVSDVKLGDIELIEDKHYTVTYELNGAEIAKEDVIEAGNYTVVVSGTGTEAMCAFDAAGGEHTKKDGLNGSVSGEFTIEDSTEKPDDGKPDDGKPDDGKPDDDNPDDGKPDDGNPDDGNPDNNPGSHSGGSHSGSGGGSSSGVAGSGTSLGSYTIYTDDNGRSGHWVIEDIGYVNSEGLWVNEWWFSYSDGTYPYNEWVHLTYNGSGAWYFFDENGWMVDGWLNRNGNTYYLHAIPDGTRGYMYTGWNQIDGIWYYFSEDAGTLGALLKNTITPDGHFVDENGRMIL